jgi:hypothetical protein
MATNSIGSFNFVRLSSVNGRADAVETVYQHTDIIQRPGVDGTGLIQLGLKGDPFQLSSFVDVDTFANAQVLRLNYKSLVGYGPQIVICAGTNYYNPLGHKYFVLGVQAEASRIGKSTGGLVGGAQAKVDAIWTLLPVYVGYP